MRSRYTAYKLQIPKYIINTTHNKNIDFKIDNKIWEKEILEFCQNCNFDKLTIKEFIDGKNESFVTFEVKLECDNKDNSFIEKSRFIKEFNKWYYIDGIFLENL